MHSAGCCLPVPLSSSHSVTSSHMGPNRGQPSGVHLFCIILQIMQNWGRWAVNKKKINTYSYSATKVKDFYTGHYPKQGCQCVLSIPPDFPCKKQRHVMRKKTNNKVINSGGPQNRKLHSRVKARHRSTEHNEMKWKSQTE